MTRTMQAGCLVIASVSFGYGFLYTGPPPGDPSAWNDLVIGTHHTDGPEHMNHGTFEGGATGTKADVIANNVRDGSFSGGGGFDVPSGGPPSPDFGAEKFTAKMLRFEEFGLKPMETTYAAGSPLPPPFNGDAGCCPDGQALDKSAKKSKEEQNYADQILAGAWPGVGDHGGPAWAIRAHSHVELRRKARLFQRYIQFNEEHTPLAFKHWKLMLQFQPIKGSQR